MAKQTEEIGKNVKVTVNGNKMVIECDLSADFGPTKSGKTNIVATTSGFAGVPGHEGVILSMNLNRKG